MEFEWDEDKNVENIKKHGVSFEEAELAFQDENAVELFDELNSDEEIRFQIIALSPARLLFVAFTIREENIRIISARKADAKQVKIYNEYNG
ncbi:MAG: BrnT family toxin [Pyrinomonadaceae bacterium MAG19_C2-C3]|nr:BrnT family toxin [Pyrinomonadaceae bacterium MAG19_C2-C3]